MSDFDRLDIKVYPKEIIKRNRMRCRKCTMFRDHFRDCGIISVFRRWCQIQYNIQSKSISYLKFICKLKLGSLFSLCCGVGVWGRPVDVHPILQSLWRSVRVEEPCFIVIISSRLFANLFFWRSRNIQYDNFEAFILSRQHDMLTTR